MPNKPDKFEIKLWLACDVNSKYTMNGFLYSGKDERRYSSIQLGEFIIVLKLIDPFTRYGRNVATNKFCTSVSQEITCKKYYNFLTFRGNKKIMSKLVKKRKDKIARFSRKSYKANYITFTVYTDKPKKEVI